MSADTPGDHEYSPGNTAPDGGYVVGKGKPPESGKFRKGDGRQRGRRKKGTRNLATDFLEEMASPVTLSVNGKPRKITRQRAIVMRLMDNASRGQNNAIEMAFQYGIQFGANSAAANEPTGWTHIDTLSDEELATLERLIMKACGMEEVPDASSEAAGGP